MKKKIYPGLEAEKITFGDNDINTVSLWHYSGCYLGTVSLYTEDGEGRPLPWGVCWVKDQDTYSFHWAAYVGDITYE